jgi:hypothetical protein
MAVLRILHDLGLPFFTRRRGHDRLSDEQKADRAAICKSLIKMTSPLGPRQLKYLITGDESWIYSDNELRGMWADDRDEISRNVKRMISSKETMFSVYFERWGLVSIEFLPQGRNYSSEFFVETI